MHPTLWRIYAAFMAGGIVGSLVMFGLSALGFGEPMHRFNFTPAWLVAGLLSVNWAFRAGRKIGGE